MDVAAVDVEELAGGVAGAIGEEERNSVGDFVGSGHAMAEGDAAFDVRAGGGWLGLRREPGFVHGSPAFGNDDGVHANGIFGQLDGPFAR